MIPFLLASGLIVYLLKEEKVAGSGWAFYSYIFFLTISFIILLLLYILSVKKE